MLIFRLACNLAVWKLLICLYFVGGSQCRNVRGHERAEPFCCLRSLKPSLSHLLSSCMNPIIVPFQEGIRLRIMSGALLEGK
jgi:hypothetical protein